MASCANSRGLARDSLALRSIVNGELFTGFEAVPRESPGRSFEPRVPPRPSGLFAPAFWPLRPRVHAWGAPAGILLGAPHRALGHRWEVGALCSSPRRWRNLE